MTQSEVHHPGRWRVGTLIMLAGALAASAATAGEPAAGGTPRLVCAEARHDFGRMYSTSTVVHAFFINNEGSAPLLITRVRTRCGGCTTTEVSSTNVPPNDWAQISAAYRLAGRSGRQEASIYVETSDPKCRMLELKLTGDVIPVKSPIGPDLPADVPPVVVPIASGSSNTLQMDPGAFSFGTVTNGITATNTVIVTASGSRCRVLHADTPQAGVALSVETVEEGRQYAVHARTIPGAAPSVLDSTVRLVLKDYKVHYVHLPLTGRIMGTDSKKP